MADLLAYGEDIIGFPGGEAKAKVKLMDLLWENPDPSATFAGQDILLDLTSFDMVYIQGSDSSCIVSKSVSNRLQRVEYADATSTSTGTLGIWRNVYVTDSYVSFGDCKSVFTTRAVYTSNNYCRPYQIYGIKLEQEIPVVAENVSTLAANCLLSDGETSVEDRLNAIITDVEVGSTSINIGPSTPSTAVSFTKNHDKAPSIVLLNSQNPNVPVSSWHYTKTGFDARGYFSTTNTQGVYWIAIWA